MAVNYKIYKSTVNNQTNGKFYARASHRDTVTVKELAQTMQANCTVKYSDIVAVLTELSEVMRAELQRGNRVKLDGIGSFKIGIRSKGAKSIKEFNPQENIIGTRVIFLPECTGSATGKRMNVMLSGLKIREEQPYDDLRADENDAADGE